MNEESWHHARLIPTSGINGAVEQERRATSALLAVMSSVKEFGRALVQPLGAPAGALETFVEVPFLTGENKCYPDGLIRVRRGQRVWTALVEVKTGTNVLEAPQLETYLDVAKEQSFDALITISNEIPAMAGSHPTKIDKKKIRKTTVHHLSWSHVLAEAVMQKEHRGVADPDQAWILGELIRYLEHPRSGALQFDDMGPSWVAVRDAVTASTLRPTDKTAPEVAARFDALLRFASLRLGRQLGAEVTPALSRKDLADPAARSAALVQSLATSGTLTGAIRIPHTVGNIEITADLRAGTVTCHVDVAAPKEGRPQTRVNWLIRQLKNAPDTVRVEAFTARSAGAGSTELLRAIRETPALLVADPLKELRSFRVALAQPLGSKRGIGRGSFIDSVLDSVDGFYGEVMQNLKAWSAAPPKVREPVESSPGPAALTSTALSSQDGAEPSHGPGTTAVHPEPRDDGPPAP